MSSTKGTWLYTILFSVYDDMCSDSLINAAVVLGEKKILFVAAVLFERMV